MALKMRDEDDEPWNIEPGWPPRRRRAPLLALFVAFALAVALIALLGALIFSPVAHGASANDKTFCTLWARAALARDIGLFDEVRRATATIDSLRELYLTEFSACYSADEPPDLPNIENDETFLARLLAVLHPPAEDLPGDRVCGRRSPADGAPGSAERAAWCKRAYGSFDPATGTVICRNGKRAPCT